MEALAVLAIVAILAAVAVPVYNNYLTNQRQATVENLAQAAAVAANSYYRRNNVVPDSARLGLFLPVANKYYIQVNDPNVTVRDATNPSSIYSTVRYR